MPLKVAGAKKLGIVVPKTVRFSVGRTTEINGVVWTYIGTDGNDRIFVRVHDEPTEDTTSIGDLDSPIHVELLRENKTTKRTAKKTDPANGIPAEVIQTIIVWLTENEEAEGESGSEGSESDDSEDGEESLAQYPPTEQESPTGRGKKLAQREQALLKREWEMLEAEKKRISEERERLTVGSGRGENVGALPPKSSTANYDLFLKKRPTFDPTKQTVAKFREDFEEWWALLKTNPQYGEVIAAYSFRTETAQLSQASSGATLRELLELLEKDEFVSEGARLGSQFKSLADYPAKGKPTEKVAADLRDINKACKVEIPDPYIGLISEKISELENFWEKILSNRQVYFPYRLILLNKLGTVLYEINVRSFLPIGRGIRSFEIVEEPRHRRGFVIGVEVNVPAGSWSIGTRSNTQTTQFPQTYRTNYQEFCNSKQVEILSASFFCGVGLLER